MEERLKNIPEGIKGFFDAEWGRVPATLFRMRNMSGEYDTYAYITKPNTDFNIHASIKKVKV